MYKIIGNGEIGDNLENLLPKRPIPSNNELANKLIVHKHIQHLARNGSK
jgi:hypothetical protein